MHGCGKAFTWHETDATNACLYKDSISEKSSDWLQEKNPTTTENILSSCKQIKRFFCPLEPASLLAFLLIKHMNLENWLNIESMQFFIWHMK